MNEKFTKKVPVAVPNRSGFDKSYRNTLTGKCGTLIPIFCDEVIPNTTVNLDLAMSIQLPPLASETFMNVDYKVEAFFVPTRLVMAGYDKWLVGEDSFVNNSGVTWTMRAPIVKFRSQDCAPGSLADYLGVMYSPGTSSLAATDYSIATAFPFLAYHLIWDDWYRNSLVQKSLYRSQFEATANSTQNSYYPSNMKFYVPRATGSNYILTNSTQFADGSNIFALRQRNFGSDYFTMATPSAQNGDAQKVSMVLPQEGIIRYEKIAADTPVQVSSGVFAPMDYATSAAAANGKDGDIYFDGIQDPSGNYVLSASFTIASLRAANSMQQFLERNNLIGNRLVDYVKGHYGATLLDSIAQRPVYLGSMSVPVYSKGVYQTAKDSNSGNNPFDSVGSRYGHAYSEANQHLIHYTAEEPGYIMILGSLVPQVTYSSGIERYLSRYLEFHSQSDMANPILQNVGNEPIFHKELSANLLFATNNNESNNVFGYVERYASWKTRNNQLHGLLRDGQTLEAFALQRNFPSLSSSIPDLEINSSFLKIPISYMDQVTAVDQAISNYGYWADFYFNYKVSMPLYEYSLPSLQDPAWEHGNIHMMNRGGKQID